MKYLKYLILIMVILTIALIFNGKTFYKEKPKEEMPQTIIEDNVEEIIEEAKNEKIKEEVLTPENDKEEVIITTLKTENIEKPKTEEKKNVQTNNNDSNNNVQEKPKQATAWEELGITEYEYYNSPMWSWATIDFKLSDYGTQQKTEQACQNYGHKLMEEQDLGFSCTNVNSYAGTYLGEMFETF